MASPKKMWTKRLTTNEIVDIINDLASDDETTGADVYIDPPGDGLVSDSDSGDETNVHFDNLLRRQLLAPAELVVYGTNTRECDESEEESDMDSARQTSTGSINEPSNAVTDTGPSPSTSRQSRPSVSRGTRKRPLQSRVNPPPQPTAPRAARKWVKRDIPRQHEEWTVPPPRSVISLSETSDPVEYFELFFSHEVIMHIVRHTVIYAVIGVMFSLRKRNADHMIARAPSRLRCAYCKSLTVTFCQKCEVNLHSKCFSAFHS